VHEHVEPETPETVLLDLDLLSYDDWEDGEATPGPCVNYLPD